MKKLLVFLAVTASCCISNAQQYDYLENLKAHPEQMSGCDYLCPTDNTPLTATPQGYEAFYISHYSRHGARYAWQSDLYDRIRDVLFEADSLDNLTPIGKEYLAKFRKIYPEIQYSYGELSRKGWEQQQNLGKLMYTRFPEVFDDNSKVTAATSPVQRCVMSMSAFCLGLNDCNPEIEITENVGRLYLHQTIPQSKDNPFRIEAPKCELLFTETWPEYIERSIDYRAILDRVFIDKERQLPSDKQWDFLYYLNYFAHGMASLDTDLSFSEIFTEEECLALWKIDCFQFYTVAWPTHLGYRPIVQDIISCAEKRLASGEKGAELRFGHDTSFLPLLMNLGVNGYDHECENGDEIPVWCRMNDVPMAANLILVFYRPSTGNDGDILIKALLNGKEARLPLPDSKFPYYRWEDFKEKWK
ncbi:MAG: histidine-type phosphatase [Bacteroidales bacterium]|nr:histidine-type phosphatase [Candidatus Cacconaster merdequi]